MKLKVVQKKNRKFSNTDHKFKIINSKNVHFSLTHFVIKSGFQRIFFRQSRLPSFIEMFLYVATRLDDQ